VIRSPQKLPDAVGEEENSNEPFK